MSADSVIVNGWNWDYVTMSEHGAELETQHAAGRRRRKKEKKKDYDATNLHYAYAIPERIWLDGGGGKGRLRLYRKDSRERRDRRGRELEKEAEKMLKKAELRSAEREANRMSASSMPTCCLSLLSTDLLPAMHCFWCSSQQRQVLDGLQLANLLLHLAMLH